MSNENDALLDVLNGALDLDDKTMKKLATQLQVKSLENIVATIEVLQRRAMAVQKLRFVMSEHYREVLETPDLQQIIERNTWIFGPKYETIGAEEDNFTTLNSRGQPIYKFIVIEIKRPAISLNKKHLRQLEDYADITKKYPEFTLDKMHFELILVGQQISSVDEQIKSRLNSLIPRGEHGLVTDEPRMKLFVMNWYTLLDSFELSNGFMLEQLKIKRAGLSGATKEELVAELQEAY